jgi:hypothetical protein
MSASLDTDIPSDLFYIINYAYKFAITLLDLTYSFTIIFTIAINRQYHNVSKLLACHTCVVAIIH